MLFVADRFADRALLATLTLSDALGACCVERCVGSMLCWTHPRNFSLTLYSQCHICPYARHWCQAFLLLTSEIYIVCIFFEILLKMFLFTYIFH